MNAPRTLTPTDVIALQRTVGNRAVQRILADHLKPGIKAPIRPAIVQAKLKVGPANDPYEREADRVAEQVTSRLTHASQQGPTPLQPEQKRVASPAKMARAGFHNLSPGAPNVLQRKAAIINNKVYTKVVRGALTGSAKNKISQVGKGAKQTQYERFDEVQIEDDDSAHVKDKDGNIVWYRIKDTPNEYIRAAKVFVGISSKPNKAKAELEGESAKTVIGATGSWWKPYARWI
jgi:hypothetical protein